MTLLTIVQGAAESVNFPSPSSVVGNANPSVVQWLQLAKRSLREVARRHDWQSLVVEHTWTTTATVTQASALASDYDHLPPDVEIWSRTSAQRLAGPTPSDVWSTLKNSSVTASISGWWRIIGNVLNIYPAPTAGRTYALEYVSKNHCQSSGGTAKETWTADTDVARVPEHLLELDLTWRWLHAKGVSYAEDMATFERELDKAASRDRAVRVMLVGKRRDDAVLAPAWSGTITVP